MQTQHKLYSDFNELPEGYLQLLDGTGCHSFDQTLPWYESLCEFVLPQNFRLRIHGVEDQNSGRAIAVLPVVEKLSAIPLAGSQILPLGNYYTSIYEPILSSEQNVEKVVAKLGQGLISSSSWFEMDLNPMNKDSLCFDELIKFFRKAGFYVQPYFRFGNWYTEIKERSFDEYYLGLPSRLRETLKRKHNKLHKKFDTTVRIVSSTEGLDEALADYESVYRKSWKIAEPFPQFIRQISRRFAKDGWLRLGLIYVDKVPVAAQIWFVKNRTASIFKLAYDNEYSSYSVGSLLTMALMRHVIDVDQVGIVDYLCGDDDYKKDWMSTRRERWGLRIYRTASLSGFLCAIYQRICGVVKKYRSVI